MRVINGSRPLPRPSGWDRIDFVNRPENDWARIAPALIASSTWSASGLSR
jgi:hypothetical protein